MLRDAEARDAVSLGRRPAAEHYTHFTSPIRRYPDLVVHRMLRQSRRGAFLSDRSTIAPPGEARLEQLAEELPETGRQSSEMERRADEAERELLQWKKVRFMSDKVGDEYEGFVTGVAPFGLFVELVEHYVEGLVHVSSMADDYYRYIEQQHVMYGENTKDYRLGGSPGAGGAGGSRAPADRLGVGRDLEAVREEGRPRQVRSRVKPKIQKRARPGRGSAPREVNGAGSSRGHAAGVVRGGLARGVRVADTLADTAAQLGQPVRAEDDDRDHEHDQDFGHAKVHTTPVRRAVGPGERPSSKAPNS
jgi:ribonuclease R